MKLIVTNLYLGSTDPTTITSYAEGGKLIVQVKIPSSDFPFYVPLPYSVSPKDFRFIKNNRTVDVSSIAVTDSHGYLIGIVMFAEEGEYTIELTGSVEYSTLPSRWYGEIIYDRRSEVLQEGSDAAEPMLNIATQKIDDTSESFEVTREAVSGIITSAKIKSYSEPKVENPMTASANALDSYEANRLTQTQFKDSPIESTNITYLAHPQRKDSGSDVGNVSYSSRVYRKIDALDVSNVSVRTKPIIQSSDSDSSVIHHSQYVIQRGLDTDSSIITKENYLQQRGTSVDSSLSTIYILPSRKDSSEDFSQVEKATKLFHEFELTETTTVTRYANIFDVSPLDPIQEVPKRSMNVEPTIDTIDTGNYVFARKDYLITSEQKVQTNFRKKFISTAQLIQEIRSNSIEKRV